MTSQEFNGPFNLLCRGLDCQPTPEQMSAWYRRLEHVTLTVWKNVVDTLLFDGRKSYFPKLEHVLNIVEKETEWVRKAMIERDKFSANKTYVLLNSPVNSEEQSRIPYPGSALFLVIKAFSGRRQAQKMLQDIPGSDLHELQKKIESDRLNDAIMEYDREIKEYSPMIHNDDAARLVLEYESK